MNPGSCCFTLMGGLRYGETHMSTCIHHVVCQHYRLVVVVRWCGVCFMVHIGFLSKVEQCLNATGYLNIIANQVHPLMAAVCPSAN